MARSSSGIFEKITTAPCTTVAKTFQDNHKIRKDGRCIETHLREVPIPIRQTCTKLMAVNIFLDLLRRLLGFLDTCSSGLALLVVGSIGLGDLGQSRRLGIGNGCFFALLTSHIALPTITHRIGSPAIVSRVVDPTAIPHVINSLTFPYTTFPTISPCIGRGGDHMALALGTIYGRGARIVRLN